MLPFRRNRDDGVGAGPVEIFGTIHDKPDESAEFDMLDAVAEDLITAMGQKDKALLKEALRALCDYVQDLDAGQDEQLLGA